MSRRISHWTVLAAVLALTLIGCGSGDESTPGATAAPSAASAPPATDASEPGADDEPDDNGQTYVVQSGDTLSAIARRFDTTVEAIVKANDIKNPDAIDVGDELVIPGGQ